MDVALLIEHGYVVDYDETNDTLSYVYDAGKQELVNAEEDLDEWLYKEGYPEGKITLSFEGEEYDELTTKMKAASGETSKVEAQVVFYRWK